VGGLLTSEALAAFKALGIFEITGVVNNQTGNPIVSHIIFSVLMHRGPMNPKEGKVKGSPRKGVPPLVLPRVDAIETNLTQGPLRKKNNTRYKSEK
jgi:hypothetical protein